MMIVWWLTFWLSMERLRTPQWISKNKKYQKLSRNNRASNIRKQGPRCLMMLSHQRTTMLRLLVSSELAAASIISSVAVFVVRNRRPSLNKHSSDVFRNGLTLINHLTRKDWKLPSPWWGCMLISQAPSKICKDVASTLILSQFLGMILSSISHNCAPFTWKVTWTKKTSRVYSM